MPLKVVESPYREITKPVLDYVKRVRTKNPRDVVTVFVPEYVVGHWWEQLLHNQSALRLKSRLLFQPGVMVYQRAMAAEVVRADRGTGRADPGCRPPGLPDRPARRPGRRAVAVLAGPAGRSPGPTGRRRPGGRAGTAPVPARQQP